MRFALAAAIAVALAGCGQSDVQRVIDGTRKLCGFQPTVEVVAAILGSSIPGVSGVGPVTNAICAAVADEKLGVMSACPQVNGVCIEGDFVE